MKIQARAIFMFMCLVFVNKLREHFKTLLTKDEMLINTTLLDELTELKALIFTTTTTDKQQKSQNAPAGACL